MKAMCWPAVSRQAISHLFQRLACIKHLHAARMQHASLALRSLDASLSSLNLALLSVQTMLCFPAKVVAAFASSLTKAAPMVLCAARHFDPEPGHSVTT